MPNYFEISGRRLKAVRAIASNDETRLAINGVHVEMRQGEPPKLIATDGRRLLTLDLLDVFFCCLEDCAFTIPSHLIDAIQHDDRLRVVRDDSTVKLEALGLNGDMLFSISGPAIDAAFPTWRRVVPDPMPETLPGRTCPWNVELLIGGLTSLRAVMGVSSPACKIVSKESDDPEKEPIVLLAKNVTFVLMPMRGEL